MTVRPIRQSLVTLFCLAALSVSAAYAQDPSGSSGQSAGAPQATATTQTVTTQPSTGLPEGRWELGAGFDTDTHATGYGWFGPTYEHYLRDNLRLTAKGTVNYLFYEYENGSGRTKVSGPGIGTQIGLKFGGRNWFKVGAGPAFKRRNTKFVFADGSEADGGGEWRVGLNVGADVYLVPTGRTNFMGQYQYGTEDNFFWTRAMGRRQISNYSYTGRFANWVGAEVIGMGNEDFKSMQYGGLFEISHVASSASIQLRAGYKRQTFDFGDAKTGPYFGIGYWQRLK